MKEVNMHMSPAAIILHSIVSTASYATPACAYEKMDLSSLEEEVELIKKKKSKLSANARRATVAELKRLKMMD